MKKAHQTKEMRASLFTKKLVIKKSTIWAFLSLILFRIVLDSSYIFVISQVWNYTKFELHLNSIKLVESYFLFLIIFVLMPKSSKKLSNVMVWLLILLSYIPMLTLFALKDESRIFMYAVTGFWLMVFLLLHIPKVSLPSLKQAGIIRFFLFVSLPLIVFLMVYQYFGLTFNFDLKKVYEIRAKYVEMKVPFASYLFNWVAKVVNPILFAIFVTKRKWFFTGLVIFLQILLFSVTGHKGFFFALPFVLVLMWIITRKNPLAYMGMGLVGIILLGMLSYWLIDDSWVSSLFVRRSLLVPPQLNFFYYDFFSEHEYIYLSSHRIFQTFLDYPYHLDPPRLIGEVYFNSPKMNANTGLVGDAYMNFGFAGLVLWSILLVLILKLVDTCSKGKDIRIAIAAIAIPTTALRSSALLTNILTHGLLLVLLLLYLLPKKKITNV